MDKKTSFLKKNSGFVMLLALLLFIASSLGIYVFIKNNEEEAGRKQPTYPNIQQPTKKNVEINDFVGNYQRLTGQISFRWNVSVNSASITSIKLYHGDNELLDVTSYSSYDLPRESYGIHTGDNKFTLQVTQSDGKVITKESKVFVDYLVSMEQEVNQTENKTSITLVYQYEKEHRVNEPQMILLDDQIGYAYLRYKGTKSEEKDGLVTAKTTYEFTWNENPPIFETFSVRWSFKDINDSRDFFVEKGISPKAD